MATALRNIDALFHKIFLPNGASLLLEPMLEQATAHEYYTSAIAFHNAGL